MFISYYLAMIARKVAFAFRIMAQGAELAVALQAALKPRGGLWFGWSGKTSEESGPASQCRTVGSLTYAVCDLSRRHIEQYYLRLRQQTKPWPLPRTPRLTCTRACMPWLVLAEYQSPDDGGQSLVAIARKVALAFRIVAMEAEAGLIEDAGDRA